MLCLCTDNREGQWKWPQVKNGIRKRIICSLYKIRIGFKSSARRLPLEITKAFPMEREVKH